MAARRLRQLETVKPSNHWLTAYDQFSGWMEDASAPLSFVSNVHPDKAIRDASEACEQRWTQFSSTLFQDEALYRHLRQVKAADGVDQQALKNLRESFEDSGVGLPKPRRKLAKQLQDRIAALGIEFGKNLRNDVDKIRVEFSEAELAGVPETVWREAPRAADGKFQLKLDYPSYDPVMAQASSGATRERMWRAFMNRGGEANLKLLSQISHLRREYAALFGFKSYADFLLRRRMVGNVATAQHFLDDVKGAVRERELHDIDDIRKAKAMRLGQAVQDTPVERWDVAFYTEQIRRDRYSVDEEAMRQYFPPEESLKFVMRLAEHLFGIKYTPVDAVLWHPDAHAFEVSDAATGKPLAGLIVDLYPREGKYGHAAVWQLRSGSSALARLPQAALVVNFNRKGLTLEELETLLHEFGHSLHVDLSNTRYSIQSGTSVMTDFVEAPSQMLEDWALEPTVLALFKEVCPDCKPVPGELVQRVRTARDYGKGVFTARQHLYATYDLALHGPQVEDPLALWARMEGATALGHVSGTRFPAGFAHVAQNYGAGYYGYLWSLVVAMDLRTAFKADRLDPAVGRRYRETVLAQGSQRPPGDLVKNFLGRDLSNKAFFEDLNR